MPLGSMTAKFPMIVRFNRPLATTLLICGGAIFLSSTLQFLVGRFPLGLIASFAFLLGGITLQRHSYFRLDRRELIVYKPTGVEDYRCALTSVCDLEIDQDSGAVYLLSSGERRKMPLYSWLAEDQDWAQFEQLVASKDQAARSDAGEAEVVESPKDGNQALDEASAEDVAEDVAENVIDVSKSA